MAKKNQAASSSTIVRNKKATHDYFIVEQFTAGVALQGWEVKSLRAGRAQLKESYVIHKNGELFLYGAHFSPLTQASSHMLANPIRERKLLLNRKEINRLIGAVKIVGHTIMPLSLFWQGGKVKANIALGKGKKQYDKRETIKRREWDRDRQRLMKQTNR